MSDLLPKDADGNLVGKNVAVEYDVVDLPGWDFTKLVGGPVLRATFGILKKMIEDAGQDFPEAFRPLLELADKEQKIEVTKELLDFVDIAFKALNQPLDAAAVSKVLKTVFPKEEEKMIKSIFDEKYDVGFADGKAELGRNMVLTALRTKFGKVPKGLEKGVLGMSDPIALESLLAQAIQCNTLNEFADLLE